MDSRRLASEGGSQGIGKGLRSARRPSTLEAGVQEAGQATAAITARFTSLLQQLALSTHCAPKNKDGRIIAMQQCRRQQNFSNFPKYLAVEFSRLKSTRELASVAGRHALKGRPLQAA
jgi:hypothetical protein